MKYWAHIKEFLYTNKERLIGILSISIMLVQLFQQYSENEIAEYYRGADQIKTMMVHKLSLSNQFKLQQIIALEKAHFYDTSLDKSSSSVYSNYKTDSITPEKYKKLITEMNIKVIKGEVNISEFYSFAEQISKLEAEQQSEGHERLLLGLEFLAEKGTPWQKRKNRAETTQLVLVLFVFMLSILKTEMTDSKQNKTK